jgi:phosphate transport system substrate-binding protein
VRDEAGVAIEATLENVQSLKYPLARRLFLHVNAPKTGKLRPAVRAFLLFTLSHTAQVELTAAGYLALPPTLVETERAKVP